MSDVPNNTPPAPEPETGSAPRTFRALAITLADRLTQNLHVSASGITMFALFGAAKLFPQKEAMFEGLAQLAAVYLFGSSVAKK